MIVAEQRDEQTTEQVRHAAGIAPDGTEWCMAGCGRWPCLPVLERRAAAE